MHRISVWSFCVLGVYQIGLGAYFVAVRPALLPEDIRLIGAPTPPGLEPWLDLVFTVMGGQMAAVGVLIVAFASRILCQSSRRRIDVLLLGLAGLLSAGLMSGVNFALGSDFKWLLVVPVALWVAAIALAAAAPGKLIPVS